MDFKGRKRKNGQLGIDLQRVSTAIIFYEFISTTIRKAAAAHPDEVAFLLQLGLGRQPVVHIMTVLRALVQIIGISPPGHLLR